VGQSLRKPEILVFFPGGPLTYGFVFAPSVRYLQHKHVSGAQVARND
jgi:hypothetical protein